MEQQGHPAAAAVAGAGNYDRLQQSCPRRLFLIRREVLLTHQILDVIKRLFLLEVDFSLKA